MIRTFVDSGVLISAARGADAYSENAKEAREEENISLA